MFSIPNGKYFTISAVPGLTDNTGLKFTYYNDGLKNQDAEIFKLI